MELIVKNLSRGLLFVQFALAVLPDDRTIVRSS